MASNETTLETAAFLASPHAASIPGADRNVAGEIVNAFLGCAFSRIGKAPRHLDGDDMHTILGHLLPESFVKKDARAAVVAPALLAYLNFLEERSVLPQSYELRAALERDVPLFLRIVETGETHRHGHGAGGPERPFQHRAEKVGRNDPCPCGSGKKFKQCCAKLGS